MLQHNNQKEEPAKEEKEKEKRTQLNHHQIISKIMGIRLYFFLVSQMKLFGKNGGKFYQK